MTPPKAMASTRLWRTDRRTAPIRPWTMPDGTNASESPRNGDDPYDADEARDAQADVAAQQEAVDLWVSMGTGASDAAGMAGNEHEENL